MAGMVSQGDFAAPENARQIVLHTYSGDLNTSGSLVADAMYPADALAGLPEPVKELALGVRHPVGYADLKPGEVVLDLGSGLDSAASRDVGDMLKRYRRGGQTILLVTHDVRVASAAGRVLQMRDGQIVGEKRSENGRDPRPAVSQRGNAGRVEGKTR